jgi:hypothetical protein
MPSLNKNHIAKIFLVLLVLTGYLVGFSHLGVYAYDKFVVGKNTFSDQTFIGSVNVSNQTEQNASSLLSNAIRIWQSQSTIEIQFEENKFPLNQKLFTFNINRSIIHAKSGVHNPLEVSLDDQGIKQQIERIFAGVSIKEFNIHSLESSILKVSSNLNKGPVVFNLSNYVDTTKSVHPVAETTSIPFSAKKEIQAFIDDHPSIKISKKSQFSFNSFLKESNISIQSYDEMSKISSVIYKLVLQTNFSIIERNRSPLLPREIELGYEAKVNPEENQDLVFTNPTNIDYLVQLEMIDSRIYARLIGYPFPYTYSIKLKDKQNFNQKVVKQYSPFVDHGFEIKNPGKVGVLVSVYREVLAQDGSVKSEILMAKDFYSPVPRVEVYPLEEQKPPTDSGVPSPIVTNPQSSDSPNVSTGENPTTPSKEPSGQTSNRSSTGQQEGSNSSLDNLKVGTGSDKKTDSKQQTKKQGTNNQNSKENAKANQPSADTPSPKGSSNPLLK